MDKRNIAARFVDRPKTSCRLETVLHHLPMFPGAGRSSPVAAVASKGGKSHHTHGHGHKHEKREGKRELVRSQSNQSVLTGVHVSAPSFAGGGRSTRWGELESGSSSVSHKQPMRPLWQEGWQATSITCAVPPLYQPPLSTREPTASVSTVLEHPCDKEGRNLALHCIDMQHHIQELKSMISVLPSRQEIHPSSDTLKNAPPIPTRFWCPNSKEQSCDSLQSPGFKLPPVRLDQSALHLLQRKSVAAICAHSGYESSSSRALDTLADVLGDFLSKLSKLLRINADQQAENGDIGFQDVLDQSLYQCGIAGREALHKHWQYSVKGYASRLQQTAAELQEEYQRLTEPPGAKQSVSVAPSSLTLSNPSRRDTVDFRLPSPWTTSTTDLGEYDEEIPLENVMQHANLNIVAPTKTPDLGTPGLFSHFSDGSGHETDSFTAAFAIDGPPRKRLRTISLTTDQQ